MRDIVLSTGTMSESSLLCGLAAYESMKLCKQINLPLANQLGCSAYEKEQKC